MSLSRVLWRAEARLSILQPSSSSVLNSIFPSRLITPHNEHHATHTSITTARPIVSTRSFHQSLPRTLLKTAPLAPNQRLPLTYRIAAAYNGKDTSFSPSDHHFLFDSTTGKQSLGGKPLDAAAARDSRQASGQDAFFAGAVGGSTGATAFGVADGVGGWAEQGIDSAAFAHGLCNCMAAAAASFPVGFGAKTSAPGTLDPQALLQEGYTRVCADETIEGGGSTACVAVADPSGELHVANLGDSGFVHLRPSRVHHVSAPQQHAFNTPFQLSHLPAAISSQIANFGGGAPLGDVPAHAHTSAHALRPGDVVVFGTDGLWDNLAPQDVLALVGARMRDEGVWIDAGADARSDMAVADRTQWVRATSERAQGEKAPPPPLQAALAVAVVTAAKQASLDRKRDGPFAKAVQRAYPRERWHGGKIDDICVVIVVVVEDAGSA